MSCNVICPGFGHVWMALVPNSDPVTGQLGDATGDCGFFDMPSSGSSWFDLPAIKSSDLVDDTTDPTEIRHSGTNGVRSKPCPGSTSYDLTVEAYLCPDDWLYNYILQRAVCQATTQQWGNPGAGKRAWFYASWSSAAPTMTGPVMDQDDFVDHGIYVLGTVEPA